MLDGGGWAGSHLAAPTTLQSILLAAHPVQRWPGYIPVHQRPAI